MVAILSVDTSSLAPVFSLAEIVDSFKHSASVGFPVNSLGSFAGAGSILSGDLLAGLSADSLLEALDFFKSSAVTTILGLDIKEVQKIPFFVVSIALGFWPDEVAFLNSLLQQG